MRWSTAPRTPTPSPWSSGREGRDCTLIRGNVSPPSRHRVSKKLSEADARDTPWCGGVAERVSALSPLNPAVLGGLAVQEFRIGTRWRFHPRPSRIRRVPPSRSRSIPDCYLKFSMMYALHRPGIQPAGSRGAPSGAHGKGGPLSAPSTTQCTSRSTLYPFVLTSLSAQSKVGTSTFNIPRRGARMPLSVSDPHNSLRPSRFPLDPPDPAIRFDQYFNLRKRRSHTMATRSAMSPMHSASESEK
jgi:hypothetical protein